jgi:cytochrome c biogenesis protein CcmG/thiol:disulfide interchange protein DsbE
VRPPRFVSFLCLLPAVVLVVSGCNRGARPTQIGKAAPDFKVNDGEHAVQLAKYRGKVVLLNFWWSNCGPCIQETPALVALHHEHPELAILAVSIDPDPGPYHRFLDRFHVDLTTVRDPEQTVAKMYGTKIWPETYIIDRAGVIRRKVVGDPDWSNPEIRAFLQGL